MYAKACFSNQICNYMQYKLIYLMARIHEWNFLSSLKLIRAV